MTSCAGQTVRLMITAPHPHPICFVLGTNYAEAEFVFDNCLTQLH